MKTTYRVVTLSLIASSLLILGAVCAKAESYSDVMRKCGAEWRMSEERSKVQKGQGAAAWNKFRADCVKRHPYEKKQRATKSVAA